MYWVEFYTTPRGEKLFQTFLDEIEPRAKVKIMRTLGLLKYQGPELKRPYADVLRDGIRELRVRFGTNRYRAFYFFIHGNRIVITHGILKDTDEVPPAEIERALRYKADYEMRYQRGELHHET